MRGGALEGEKSATGQTQMLGQLALGTQNYTQLSISVSLYRTALLASLTMLSITTPYSM